MFLCIMIVLFLFVVVVFVIFFSFNGFLVIEDLVGIVFKICIKIDLVFMKNIFF